MTPMTRSVSLLRSPDNLSSALKCFQVLRSGRKCIYFSSMVVGAKSRTKSEDIIRILRYETETSDESPIPIYLINIRRSNLHRNSPAKSVVQYLEHWITRQAWWLSSSSRIYCAPLTASNQTFLRPFRHFSTSCHSAWRRELWEWVVGFSSPHLSLIFWSLSLWIWDCASKTRCD